MRLEDGRHRNQEHGIALAVLDLDERRHHGIVHVRRAICDVVARMDAVAFLAEQLERIVARFHAYAGQRIGQIPEFLHSEHAQRMGVLMFVAEHDNRIETALTCVFVDRKRAFHHTVVHIHKGLGIVARRRDIYDDADSRVVVRLVQASKIRAVRQPRRQLPVNGLERVAPFVFAHARIVHVIGHLRLECALALLRRNRGEVNPRDVEEPRQDAHFMMVVVDDGMPEQAE